MRDPVIDSKATALLSMLLKQTQSDVEAVQNYRDMSVPWDELVATAARLGVVPTLYDRLKSHTDVPSAVMEHLKGYYWATAVSNARLYHDLSRVLRALRAQKIDVIVLKGAFLAQAAYGDIALRPMNDIDLMVRKADLERVELLLLDLGFGPLPRRNLTEQCMVDNHHLDSFKLGMTSIEVHWVIEHENTPFRIDSDELWSRAKPFTLGGETVTALALEDLFLHVCLHASYNHGGSCFETGLRPLFDIAALVWRFKAEIDWEVVQARAKEWRVGNCIYLTIRFANHLVNAGVPYAVLNALAPPSLDPRIECCAINLLLRNISFREHLRALHWHVPSIEQILRDDLLCPWSLDKTILSALFPSNRVLANLYPRFQLPGLRYVARIAHWKDLLTDCARYYVFPNTRMKSLRATEKERLRLVRWLLGGTSPSGKKCTTI